MLSRYRALNSSFEQTSRVLLSVCTFDHRLACLCIGKLVEAKCLQVHNIANIEAKYPVICPIVLDSQCATCCDLILLLDLQFVHLLKCLERDLELFLFCHTVQEKVSSLPEIHIADLEELFLNLDQLIDYVMCLIYLFLEYFDFFRDVLTAATI